MNVTIFKTTGSGQASIRVPASKSLSHRALIAAALACGESRLYGLAQNDDIRATVRCLRQLGAVIETDAGTAVVKGIGTHLAEAALGNCVPSMFSGFDGSLVDCGESGSTLRFLLPLFAQSGKRCVFTGGGRLMERPQSV